MKHNLGLWKNRPWKWRIGLILDGCSVLIFCMNISNAILSGHYMLLNYP